MSDYVQRSNLKVAPQLADFIEREVLESLPISAQQFWPSLSAAVDDLAQENRELLVEREELQQQIDSWCLENKNSFDVAAYKDFLKKIGYLVEEGDDFQITTQNVDQEIANQAGPQLVVPTSNARFALNATNARWGSLYDALYGTDAISEKDGAQRRSAYNRIRGDRVITRARDFLDQYFPLSSGYFLPR